MSNFTARDVAAWMAAEIERDGELYQNEAVSVISDKFGSSFTYENQHGNSAISRTVLDAFRKLTSGKIVWEAHARYWRKRESGDEEGTRIA